VLRILTVEDTYTREGLAITVDTSIPGLRVRRDYNEARPQCSLRYLTPVEFRNGLSFARR
jgi:hypothetical protein